MTEKDYGKHSRKYSGKHLPKRTKGVYYTTGNPFALRPFLDWAEKINLEKLEILRLTGNELTGEIPDNLYSLSQLVYLRLGWNQLSGSISSNIGALTNLYQLAINDNNFSAYVPYLFFYVFY